MKHLEDETFLGNRMWGTYRLLLLHHGNHPQRLLQKLLVQPALIGPVQVHPLPRFHIVKRQERKGSEVMERTRGQVRLVDEPAIVHPKVEFGAVEVDPFAGDISPVNPIWGQARTGVSRKVKVFASNLLIDSLQLCHSYLVKPCFLQMNHHVNPKKPTNQIWVNKAAIAAPCH